MFENIRLSFRGIFAHKMRSFLTMLGIIIGIASIIAIVSTIQGTNEQIQKNLIGSGVNNVIVKLSQGDWEYDFYAGLPKGVPVLDDNKRKELIDIEHVENAAFFRSRQEYDGVYYLNNSLSGGSVLGIDENYLNCAGLVVKEGRGFTTHDRKHFSKVCILDENSKQSLFQDENAIGKTIEIKREPFVVIGIVTEKESFEPTINTIDDYYTYHQDVSGKVYVLDTSWPVLYQYDEPQHAILRCDSTEAMTQAGKSAENILNSFSNENVSYKAEDLLQQARDIQQLSQSTNTMLIWIAGISLLVGGIGVMNIMLVSVTERTNEIGLKKAIGAPRKSILTQFLTEAVVLSSTGGILGVITGIILAQIISRLNGTPVAINVPATVFAVVFSMFIGIIFGIIPSYKASNLDPIEALRHE